ncbi:uncharacterized protein BO66DRAFT_158214 [Aspergillus aculeatinus CBS 121060]|uniref:Uncharacterized protein n=1 Tax=Aspergillus aculeatinus CBS 121060 TaxID=1448322 RepID=A0ACD1H125_9EURO|nr:hypothetical protein BO66DRAFT_158214 [Aspergillus aculeatinus CBS 121060]RAH67273.1 hypothetical protein BO66DRAFT_158214 [Aspergillus aculeatinus CBS 121060]
METTSPFTTRIIGSSGRVAYFTSRPTRPESSTIKKCIGPRGASRPARPGRRPSHSYHTFNTTTATTITENHNATDPPLTPHLSDPEQVYISADGIHLYQPDTGFVLYAINGGSRISGDTHNPRGELAFRGWSYNYGAQFQLSLCQGKTRIRSNEGEYLVEWRITWRANASTIPCGVRVRRARSGIGSG